MSHDDRQAAVLVELRAALGAHEVLAGDASPRHLADWSTAVGGIPLAILRPRSTDELSCALAICHAHGQAVVPQGGLSRRAVGLVRRSCGGPDRVVAHAVLPTARFWWPALRACMAAGGAASCQVRRCL